MVSQFISINEGAAILGITNQTLYQWLKEGLIEHLKVRHGTRTKWLINRADFDRFIKESTTPRTVRRVGRPTSVKVEERA